MKTLYVPPNSLTAINTEVLYKLKERLGIRITTSETIADYALPIFCYDTRQLVVSNSALAPMDLTAHGVLTNKYLYKTLPVLSIPTILPLSADDLLNSELSHSKIFVKKQNNYYKNANVGFSYTKWDSVTQFINAVDDNFWQEQRTPISELGPYIVQKFIDNPYHTVGINISINDSGEILFWDAIYAEVLGIVSNKEKFGNTSTYTEDYTDLQNKIKLICSSYKLKAGIHCVEFILIDNQFYLLDWNTRITYGAYLKYLAIDSPILDTPIAHMMGLPYDKNFSFCAEQRDYRSRNFSKEYAEIARSVGLYSRFEDTPDKISRILGVDTTKDILNAKFIAFENKL